MRQAGSTLIFVILFVLNNIAAHSSLSGFGLYTSGLTQDSGEVVAMWHLDGAYGNTIVDASPYHNDGIAFGTTIVPGVLGDARFFNGRSDYIYIPDPANNSLDFDSSESFTIEAWFKSTSLADYQEVLRKGCAPIPGYIIEIKNGHVCGVIGSNANGRLPDSLLSVRSDSTYCDGNWHNVVFVRDKLLYKLFLYIDGELATSPISDRPILPLINDRPLTIGRWENTDYPCHFSGTLDEVFISRGAYHPNYFMSRILIPSKDVINFGMVEVGNRTSQNFILTNISFHDTLIVNDVSFTNQHFYLEDFPDTIYPGSKNDIKIYYEPIYAGIDSAIFSLTVKDSGITPAIVKLYGRGLMISPEPQIHSITDVADDPGRQVRIRWFPSEYDSLGVSPRIEYYSVWRRVDDLPTREITGLQGQKSSTMIVGHHTYRLTSNDLWDYIVSVPAVDFNEYSYIAPTLINTTRFGIRWTIFQVGAHADDGEVYFSQPDSGYSVDNDIPPAPTDVYVNWMSDCFTISWNEVVASDLSMYHIYRSTNEIMAPVSQFFVGISHQPSYIDYVEGTDSVYYYIVTATDSSGNESIDAHPIIGRRSVTDINDNANIPKDFYLSQNFPNPFNPSTMIEYGLPFASHLSLVIYDILGREIRTIRNGREEPGIHRVLLSLDLAGGVYFIRMEATNLNEPTFTYRNIRKVILKK